jgi:tetratricopeptide (TPR) repeat protein
MVRSAGFSGMAMKAGLRVAAFLLLVTPMLAQGRGGGSKSPPPPNPPPPLPRPDAANFDQNRLILDSQNEKGAKKIGEENNCLLPPLNSVHSSTVAVAALQIADKAQKEYGAGCRALKDKKFDAAEAHLRKAVQQEPRYSTAWVTLGQIQAARQENAEAQDSCSRALAVDPNYLLSYLCLADIAVRTGKWDEALKQSGRALQLDPANDAAAYGYNAAANLNLHRLADARQSALKALALDTSHADPRLHFLLAQIYAAEGDGENEAAQLREYLRFASDPSDAAMVKQYLAELEKQAQK